MKWKVEPGRKTIGRSFRKKMVSTDGPTLPMKNNRQSTANSIRTCEASEEMAQHGATWCCTSVVQKSRAGLFSSLVAHQVLVFNYSAVSNRVDMLNGVPINTAASSILSPLAFSM